MRRISLHTKFIVLLIGVALIPLILAVTITLTRFQQTLETDATRLGDQLAGTVSAEIRTFMVSQFRTLDNIAVLYHPGFPIEQAVADQILENILLSSENFLDISVVDATGQEIVRKDRLVYDNIDLRNKSRDEDFKTVRDQGIYIGPTYIRSGRPLFDFAREITDADGNFAGAVMAQVDGRIMQSVVNDLGIAFGEGIRVYIVSDTGKVIAHPDLSYILGETDLSALSPIQQILNDRDLTQVSGIYQNELGERVLGSVQSLSIELFDLRNAMAPRVDWYVVAEQPEAIVFAESRDAALFSIFITIVSILFALAAAFYFAGRITRPIETLHEAAQRFGRGDLLHRVIVKTGDEIEGLATSFNVMADSLRENITALESEERAMAAERNKMSLVLSGINNAVIAVDTEGHIILFNTAAEKLTGYKTEDVMGEHIKEVLNIFLGDHVITAREYCPTDKHVRDGVIFSRDNVRMISRDGTERYVNVASGNIKEGKTMGMGCILTIQDITREYFMDRTKQEFVSIAAHQLRTPLTGIKWSLEFIRSTAGSMLPESEQKLMTQTSGAVDRMIDLVNDLLDVSRIEEGRFKINPKVQELEPVMDRVVEILKRVAAKKGVAMSVEFAPDIGAFEFDAEKIEIIIDNILDNAIRYTPSGGTITLRVVRSEDKVVLSISDTGIGISKEDKERIFTKFFRANEAKPHHTDGSGLGLYVAKNVIDAHGGEIWFDSVEGEGTTFYISLPARPQVVHEGYAGLAEYKD